MGEEIAHDHFSPQDWQTYQARLKQEYALLASQWRAKHFAEQAPVAGFELEGWLVDENFLPTPRNHAFLQAFNSKLATTELARFNIELNIEPQALQGSVLRDFDNGLQQLWEQANQTAQALDMRLLLIGTLPSAQPADFSMTTMTDSNRYHALNSSILKARHGQPLQLEIDGVESLRLQHDSVMLEAAATSFQVHMQLPAQTAHHFYNAAIIASGPVMAVSANSPLLFGRQLWDETRIPVFEQSVDAGRDYPARVSFGSGFADHSIVECFAENLSRYPVLMPELMTRPAERFTHLRLHNGTVWRWNRPLIGFDEQGKPHLRLEHRVLPAGPSIPDMLANAALFYGLTQALGTQLCAGEPLPMAFATARENFYNAALAGLEARHLRWHRQEWRVQALMLEKLLPLAAQGLEQLNICDADIRHYLSIIAARIETGQTGAVWQRQHFARTQGDVQALLRDYFQLQSSHLPVHRWPLVC